MSVKLTAGQLKHLKQLSNDDNVISAWPLTNAVP